MATGSPPEKMQWPAIIEEPDGFAGRGHQPVDFGVGLDDGAHVVVEGHAARRIRPCVQPAASAGGHISASRRVRVLAAAISARRCRRTSGATCRHRPRTGSPSRAAASGAAGSPSHSASSSCSLSRPSYQPETSTRPWRRRSGASSRAFLRELAAHLGAGEAGLPGLAEAGLERRVAAELGQVVIAPSDWIYSDSHCHRRAFPDFVRAPYRHGKSVLYSPVDGMSDRRRAAGSRGKRIAVPGKCAALEVRRLRTQK